MKDTLTALPLPLSNRLRCCFDRLDSLQAWLSLHKASLQTSSSFTSDIPLEVEKPIEVFEDVGDREDNKASEDDEDPYPQSVCSEESEEELPLTAGTWPKRLIKANLMSECGLLEEEDKKLIEKYCLGYDFKTGPPVGEDSEEIRTLLRKLETFAYQGHPSFKEFTKRVQSTKRGYK